MDHGWIPSSLLEKLEGEDEVDIGGKGKKKNWVQITAGELPSLSPRLSPGGGRREPS